MNTTIVSSTSDLAASARVNVCAVRRARQVKLWSSFGTVGYDNYLLTVVLAEEARARRVS
jgi:hypothetical protein